MGPACWSTEKIGELIDNGMNVARLNFSHGNHERHYETVRNIRTAMASRKNCKIGILLDTKGPSIRTGLIGNSNKLI